jgi:hypothetical protein
MLRKLVFAAAMALGLGGSMAAIQPAAAAVMQTGAGTAVTGALETTAPAATPVYYYRYGYRPHYYRPYYRPYYRCRYVVRRVYRQYYGWVTVRRRVCGY